MIKMCVALACAGGGTQQKCNKFRKEFLYIAKKNKLFKYIHNELRVNVFNHKRKTCHLPSYLMTQAIGRMLDELCGL